MLVLFDGRIHSGLTMKDLLKQIFLLQFPGPAVLRVTSPDDVLSGRIYVHDCTYVTGASIKGSDEVGYDALRKIVTISQGSFALLSLQSGDPFESDQSLNIEVRNLAEHLDQLPDSPVELFDQTSLLDKVFNPALSSAETPQPVKVMTSPPTEVRSIFGRVLLAPDVPDVPNAETNSDIDLSALQPLFRHHTDKLSIGLSNRTKNGANGNGANINEADRAPEQGNSGELRARASKPDIATRRTVRSVLLTLTGIAIFLVIASSVGCFVRNYLEQPPLAVRSPRTKLKAPRIGNGPHVGLTPLRKPPGASDGKSRSTARQ